MGQTLDTKYTVNDLPPYTLGQFEWRSRHCLASTGSLYKKNRHVQSFYLIKKRNLTCHEEQESQTSDKEKHLMKGINETKLTIAIHNLDNR